MLPENIRLFQESITKELKYTKDRVRNLIGNANWGVDGRFKEAILSKIIGQFLPSNLRIGTGFIVSNNDLVTLLRNLSFSYFISNLLHIVSDTDPVERYWFSFPIEGTKEMYRHERIVRLQ
ncbi:hypothetical protein [Chitinophaga sp. sic0106]|uniref:hypothetical protein n=1 Tax=Chitinophaga sp. sic0106 TaxID=2854785 RepID=UPI001C44601B|nr:hypothetical protein [Chitinophaga sp. sic0106]MBV7533035.1 hypothetical protein [Chitinophaga sp. sic0106]